MTIIYNNIKEVCDQLSSNNEEVTADKILAQFSDCKAIALQFYSQWHDEQQANQTQPQEASISSEYLTALQNEMIRFSRVEIGTIMSKLKHSQEIENVALIALSHSEEALIVNTDDFVQLESQLEEAYGKVSDIKNHLDETVMQHETAVNALTDKHALNIIQLEDKTLQLEKNNKTISDQRDELNENNTLHALSISTLEEKKHELENAISEQLNELNENNALHTLSITKLEEQKYELESDNNILSSQVNELNDSYALSLAEAEDKKHELEKSTRILSSQADELNEENITYKNQFEQLENEHHDKIKQLSGQLEVIELKLRHSYEAAENAGIEAAEAAKKEISIAVNQLTAQNEKETEELVTAHDDKVDSLHDSHREKMSKITHGHEETITILDETHEEHITDLTSRHEKQCNALNRKLIDALSQAEESIDSEVIDHYQEEIEKLKSRLEQVSVASEENIINIKTTAEEKTGEFERKIIALTAESVEKLSQLRIANEIAIKELAHNNNLQLDQAGKGKQDELASLNSSIEEQSIEVSNLTDEVAKNKSLIASLESQLAENKNSGANLEEKTLAVIGLNGEITQNKALISSLESQLTASENSETENSEAMSVSREKIEELMLSLASANESVTQLQSHSDKVSSDFEEYRSSLAGQQRDFDQSKETVDNAEQSLIDLREENEQLGVQMNFIKNSSIATLQRLTTNLEHDKGMIKKLEERLEKATIDTQQAKTDKTKLAEQVDFMKHNSTTTFERLTNKAEKYASKIKSLEDELARIKV